MPDWRFVTEIKPAIGPGYPPPINLGQWIDFDGLDSIAPLPARHYGGARTRLGWMTNNGWVYMLVAEQVEPDHDYVVRDEQQPTTTDERNSHADSAMEPTNQQ